MKEILERIDRLLNLVEERLPAIDGGTEWDSPAFRWRDGALRAVRRPHEIQPDDLLHIDRQKALLHRNTGQFVTGAPANNALLWGSRGTGKSSLIKAMLAEFHDRGLRLVEVDPHDLVDLPEIVEPMTGREERFVLFADDLSFESGDASYKALKAMLDGAIAAAPPNVLIYATSNRRHLMPEFQRENLEASNIDGEIHHGESVEEKISLSERFGLWLAFHPFNQDQYLAVVNHWCKRLGRDDESEERRSEALRWALSRGSRSGRVARQFAQDWVGRHQAG
ncbi:MAG: ATP-binding protein [Gammaproteobacteria bacterium]|jgi:hypothetical protein|nr:ATP-binding protein [Gammaproteobacteria bacterium]